MITVSRAGWNARPPDEVTPLNWSKVTLFIVHYSGASRDQSVRSIQDFCMDSKGHVDIDYNELVRGANHYVGRGAAVGGHTFDHNSVSYGVCVIGQDGDATADDFNTVRTIYDQVCAKLGRQLTMTTHRNVLGADYTDCPGNELDAWVDAGMPYVGEDMSYDRTTAWRLQGYLAGDTTITVPQTDSAGSPPEFTESNEPQLQRDRIEETVHEIKSLVEDITVPPAPPIDQAALNAAVLTAISDPAVLAKIAKAVTDEIGS